MSFWKTVWQYTLGDHGFTEVWYRNATSLLAASNFPDPLLQAAVNIRNTYCALRTIRVSDVAGNRNARVINISRAAPNTSQYPDVVGTAALWSVQGDTPSVRRHVWFRGLDDNQVTFGAPVVHPIIAGNMLQNVIAFLGQLRLADFRIRYLNPIVPVTNVYNTITQVQATAGTGHVQITFSGTRTPASPDRIIIGQMSPKMWPGLNGHWAVMSSDATSVTIPYNSTVTGAIGIPKGRLRAESYSYDQLALQIEGFVDFTTRQTGKNPLGGRGRRSSVRLRGV